MGAVHNASLDQARQGDGVALILQETGLARGDLQLKLTESVLMHDIESSVLVLEALKAMGVRLTIDDIGTGYSSLSYLKRFPTLKFVLWNWLIRAGTGKIRGYGAKRRNRLN